MDTFEERQADFKVRFSAMRTEKERFAYYEKVLVPLLPQIGTTDFTHFEACYRPYKEYTQKRWRDTQERTVSGRFCSWKRASVGDLGLFMSCCTHAKLKEFLTHRDDPIDKKEVTPCAQLRTFNNCCGMKVVHFITNKKLNSAAVPLDTVTARGLDKALPPMSKPCTAGSGSGRIVSIPTDFFEKFKDIFLKSHEFEYVDSFAGTTLLVKSCISDRTRKKWEKELKGAYPDYSDYTKAKIPLTSSDLNYSSGYVDNAAIFSSFGCVKALDAFTPTPKVRSKNPFDVLVLRSVGMSSEKPVGHSSAVQQEYNNRKVCEKAGFAPMLADEHYLNSVYESNIHWLLPMYRRNPYYEEDR